MTRIAAFAALALLVPISTGIAQQARGQRPPLVVNGDSVAVVRSDQAGVLILPKGTPPFPAVILLHGCGGVTQNMSVWAARLKSWGYAALILDSFAQRGIDNVCGRGNQFPPRYRAKDAFDAAAYLQTRAEIDPARVGLIGFSHGGSTALAASVERRIAFFNAQPFKAVVAYYPYCPDIAPQLASDVQIFIGSDDDWTPAPRCADWVPRHADAAGRKPLLKIYPGAFHAFDARAPARVYFGHHLEYAAGAARDSFDMTRQFLDSRLQPAGQHE